MDEETGRTTETQSTGSIAYTDITTASTFDIQTPTTMKFKIFGKTKTREVTRHSTDEAVKRLRKYEELEGREIEALGVPYGGHIMGRDSDGEAFHTETNIWLEKGMSVPVTFYHGFGPDDIASFQGDPAIIGTAVLSEKVENEGFWFKIKLDMQEELALRVSKALEAGKDVKASSGALGHLVRHGEAGLINVWPVGELALFDTNEWRRPANELAVVRFAEGEPETEPEAKAALQVVGQATKNATVQMEEGTEPTTTEPEEDSKMDENDIKALTESVVNAVGPVIDAKLEARLKTESGGKLTNQVQVTKDEADQPWAKPGDFFKAVRTAALYPMQEDPRLKALKAPTGMSEGIPSEGGYLVPVEMSGRILERMYDTNSILGRVSTDPVSGSTMIYNGIDETTHVGSMYGGIIAYWGSEGGSMTASKPKFYQIELKLKKVYALTYATDEQLEDTANLESWLNRRVPNVLRWQVEEAIINGSGNGKPLGIMASPCLVTSNRDTTSKIALADIANMWSRRWAGVSDYVWLIGQDGAAQLNQMTAATAPVYIPQGSMANTPYATLYGCPVIETEHCQALNTTGDIILASLSQYQMISKGGVKSAQSIHVAFTTDETAFRWTYRIDGQPTWHSALTPAHGSNTVSPFVCLVSAST